MWGYLPSYAIPQTPAGAVPAMFYGYQLAYAYQEIPPNTSSMTDIGYPGYMHPKTEIALPPNTSSVTDVGYPGYMHPKFKNEIALPPSTPSVTDLGYPVYYNHVPRNSGGSGDMRGSHSSKHLPGYMHPKFKTEMCNNFNTSTGCPYGNRCQYLHPGDRNHLDGSGEKLRSQHMKNSGESEQHENQVSNGVMSNNYQVQHAKSTRYGRYYLKSKKDVSYTRQYVPRNNGGNGDMRGAHSSKHLPGYMHPKFKTEMCNKFNTSKGCPYGKICQYLHPGDRNRLDIIAEKLAAQSLRDNERNGRNGQISTSFLTEETLPMFIKFAKKAPRNGMKRYNSQGSIGTSTYVSLVKFKKDLRDRFNEEKKLLEK